MAASRDKLNLTRHHPIHAQNFTIKSHSTAQVPRLCFASTCSDVTTGPPFCGIFVTKGHTSTIFHFKSHFSVRRVTWTRESLFRKWPDVTIGPHFFFFEDLKRRNNQTPLYKCAQQAQRSYVDQKWEITLNSRFHETQFSRKTFFFECLCVCVCVYVCV